MVRLQKAQAMLRRLKVHRFRHVRPGTELVFGEQFNVLLGRNGTGKTTLLDLVSRVLRSDFADLRGEEFDLEYDLSHEHGEARIRIGNKPEPGIDRGGATRGRPRSVSREHRPNLRAELLLARVEGCPTFEITVDQTQLRWRTAPSGWSISSVPVDLLEPGTLLSLASAFPRETRAAVEAWVILHGSEQHGRWALRFDESLELFKSICGENPRGGIATAATLAVNYASSTIGSKGVRAGFVPLEVALNIVQPKKGHSSAVVELGEGELRRFPAVSGLKDMTLSLAVLGSTMEEDGEWWRFGSAEFIFTEPGGATFTHDALSYGQKRLLAFLYYLDVNVRYVVADELVNGMHHDWIRFCLDVIQPEFPTRQAFLASQNPLLLDYIPIGSEEEARRTFIQCRAEVVDGRTCFVWSNLSHDDARELYADLQVGIQHVGEILRVRGLW